MPFAFWFHIKKHLSEKSYWCIRNLKRKYLLGNIFYWNKAYLTFCVQYPGRLQIIAGMLIMLMSNSLFRTYGQCRSL